MDKNYLDSISQSFSTKKDADQFITIMSKYISNDQIKRNGNEVTCNANNKAESWFLALFVLTVVMKRNGISVTQIMMESLTILASNIKNEEESNKIIATFEDAGMTQKTIFETINSIEHEA